MIENKNTQVQEVEVPVEAPQVSSKLVITTIIYLVAIVNAAAAYLGFDFNIPTNYDFIYDGVSLVFFIGSFVHAYWKNNPVSKKARIKEVAAKQVEVKK